MTDLATASLYVKVVSAVPMEPQIPADPLHGTCRSDVVLALSTRWPRSSLDEGKKSLRVANRVAKRAAKVVTSRLSEGFLALLGHRKCLIKNNLHPAGLEPATL